MQVRHKHKRIFGIEKDFFLDLFMPKDSNYQNRINDLSIEDHRFLYYPFVFPEDFKVGSKKLKKIKKKHKLNVESTPTEIPAS